MDSSTAGQPASRIDFKDDRGGVSGEGRRGRRWHIDEERSGWRLSFRDPGDTRETNAGLFRSLLAARQEADRAR